MNFEKLDMMGTPRRQTEGAQPALLLRMEMREQRTRLQPRATKTPAIKWAISGLGDALRFLERARRRQVLFIDRRVPTAIELS